MLKIILKGMITTAIIGTIAFTAVNNASATVCDTGWIDYPEPEHRFSCIGYKYKLNVGWHGYVWLQERNAEYGDYWLIAGANCAAATGAEKENYSIWTYGEDMYWTVVGCPPYYPTLWEGRGIVSD